PLVQVVHSGQTAGEPADAPLLVGKPQAGSRVDDAGHGWTSVLEKGDSVRPMLTGPRPPVKGVSHGMRKSSVMRRSAQPAVKSPAGGRPIVGLDGVPSALRSATPQRVLPAMVDAPVTSTSASTDACRGAKSAVFYPTALPSTAGWFDLAGQPAHGGGEGHPSSRF